MQESYFYAVSFQTISESNFPFQFTSKKKFTEIKEKLKSGSAIGASESGRMKRLKKPEQLVYFLC